MPAQGGGPSTVRFTVAASIACEVAPRIGGRIRGTGTTSLARLADGSSNFATATLWDANLGAQVTTAQLFTGRPVAFDFRDLPDGLYYVELGDDNGADAVQSQIQEVDCAPVVCDLAFVAADTVVEPNTVAGATGSTGPGYALGTGAVTVRATSTAGGVQYSLTGISYYDPPVAGGSIRLGLSPPGQAPFIGLAAGTYGIYTKDAAGCVVRTTVDIIDDIPCTVAVEVGTIEDTAFIRNLAGSRLEYDWNDGRGFGDWRFRSGLAPRIYQVTAREIDNPLCTQTTDYEIFPYPSPRMCCLYFLTIGGEWFNIGEPAGLDAQELVIKRDKLHGVTFEYGDQTLEFDCDAGFDLIAAQYALYGPDVEIGFIELKRDPLNPPLLRVVYKGRLNLYAAEILDGAYSCEVEGDGLATLLAARLKTSLDLLGTKDLDGADLVPALAPTSLTRLHSKAIMKVGHNTASPVFASTGEIDRGTGQNVQVLILGFNIEVVQDLTDMFSQNTGFLLSTGYATGAQEPTYPFHVPTEAGPLEIEFLVKGWVKIQHNSGDDNFDGEFKLYYRVNDEPAELLFSCLGISTPSVPFSTDQFNNGLGLNFRATRARPNAQIGDRFYLYGVCNVYGDPNGSDYSYDYQVLLDASSFVKVTAQTTAADSVAQSLLVYEALDRGLQIALGQPGLLRSNLFGRTDSAPRQYPVLGEGGRYTLLSGLMLRGIGGKPFAPSIQDMLDGLDSPFCIGLAVELDAAGADTVRIEKAEEFYQDVLALVVPDCEDFTRKIDASRQANLVNIGFEKWQPEGRVENALDETATRRQYSTPIRYNQLEYKRYSKFIAGGYLLEAQRRVGLTSDDGKNDNDTFIIAVVKTPLRRNILEFGYFGRSAIVVLGNYLDLAAGQSVEILSGANAGSYVVDSVEAAYSGGPQGQTSTAIYLTTALPNITASPQNTQVLLGEVWQAERNEGFTLIQNLYSPDTAYNLRLTPRRMLRRHGRFLNANTYFKLGAELYRPTFAEGNQLLVTRLIGEAAQVDESAVIQRQDLAPLAETVFIPEILDFNSYLDQSGFDQLRAKRHGYIAVYDAASAAWYMGYILSVRWKRKDNLGKFQLLRRPGIYDPATSGRQLREYQTTEYNFTENN